MADPKLAFDALGLRKILRQIIVDPRFCGHVDIPNRCKELGMPDPPPMDGYSKRQRLETAFNALRDDQLSDVAARLLRLYPQPPSTRNEIQDIIWASSAEVPKKLRREISESIPPENLFGDAKAFDRLLQELWVMEHATSFGNNLSHVVQRHVHDNPGDLSTTELFELLGALTCPSARFVRFLEGLVSGDVQPDERAQHALVKTINARLIANSLELREAGKSDGYAVYRLVADAPGLGRVKQVIFGYHVKPDLRIRDAISNDIEIVGNADYYLVYDRPIESHGLIWDDLFAWWYEKRGSSGLEDRKALLKRLSDTLVPIDSPPQRLFLDVYLKTVCRGKPKMPALLPEVWLHWDHKTYAERGLDGLQRQRMDFLLLLPGGVRVVIEVDGVQHYSNKEGGRDIASPSDYAQMVSADRDLRLMGYEVYRFGGAELHIPRANDETRVREVRDLVEKFFARLFAKHRCGQ